jgi:hypothetical protein
MTTSTLPQPTDYQVQQFTDVRCLLANLYHYCLSHRKHLKTQKGRAAAVADCNPEDLNQWHFWLTTYMLLFMEKQWTNINLQGCPKLPDNYLLRLQEHTLFEGKPVDIYLKDVRLVAKEKRVLKELALRLT